MTNLEKLPKEELLSHAGELVSDLEQQVETLKAQRLTILFGGLLFLTLYLI
jgi:hypothetical protein